MSLGDLEQRVRVLEDIEAIKKLKARYCAYCDNNYDADGIASLFTEDAIWDGGSFGKCEGREAIRTHFQGAPKRMSFAIHQVMNPIIEVEGDKGKGRWYLFQPCTLGEGNEAAWLAARYEEDYVRIGGEWKFKHLKVFPSFLTPYEEGWVKKQFVQE